MENISKEKAIELLNEDGSNLSDLSSEFKKDKDIVMAAVENNNDALEHADESLKEDSDILDLIDE